MDLLNFARDYGFQVLTTPFVRSNTICITTLSRYILKPCLYFIWFLMRTVIANQNLFPVPSRLFAVFACCVDPTGDK